MQHALELARFGSLGREAGTPFEVVDQGPHHRLRRYGPPRRRDAADPQIVLVPPLMLTAEVYDMAPDISAVSALLAQGVVPWVVDFGAPEREEGGMSRSLDDHVRAVVRSIMKVNELEGGRLAHLAGYSQGGMFAYQAAAYLRGSGIRSVITFGSPVDIHKNLPAVRSDLAGAALRSVFPVAKNVLERIEGLPGKLTSTAFKIISTRKEIEQQLEFLRTLHDRERATKHHARRRFLAGEGFVAWPGPALRAFVEEFVVHNRMLEGGFVIDGRTVALSDLTCPILAFVGNADELARPATVRAIAEAAPNATVRFMSLDAGHFGLVVGSRAMTTTWPVVARWVRGLDDGALPEALISESDHRDNDRRGRRIAEIDLALDVANLAVKDAWRRVADVLASANDTADLVRWQEPRLRRLARIEPDTLISASGELARRAQEAPTATFFLWRDRAFSFEEANRRVSSVAGGLFTVGVRRGDLVLVVMRSRPSFLSAISALSRLGATAIIAPPNASARQLADALEDVQRMAAAEPSSAPRVLVDPEHVEVARTLSRGADVLLLGGGPRAPSIEGVRDLEALGEDETQLPNGIEVDGGRARDLGYVLLRPHDADGRLRPMPVTNHRWALSAIGAAAACEIKPSDTVFCPLPLQHPTGLLVGVGAALAGGARLALTTPTPGAHGLPATEELLAEIRRTGATVVFYAGEILRALVNGSAEETARTRLPTRVFAGSGMRPALAARLRDRWGAETIEFYAGTAHRAILANISGDVSGTLGTVLPGSAETALVQVDLDRRACAVDADGHLERVSIEGAPGLLAVSVDPEEEHTLEVSVISPELTKRDLTPPVLVRDAFGDGSAWLVTNDVISRDREGKHTFVDALSGFVKVEAGARAVSLRRIEDALYTLPEVELAAAWVSPALEVGAAFVSREAISEDRLREALAGLAHIPRTVARVASLPLNEGFRPVRAALPPEVALTWYAWRDDRYVEAPPSVTRDRGASRRAPRV